MRTWTDPRPKTLLVVFALLTVVGALLPGTATAATYNVDDFEGTTLASIWTWVNPGASSGYQVDGGALSVNVGKSNDQGPGVNKAPRVLQPAPTSPWTTGTRVLANSGNAQTFAGVVVYKDNANWLMWGQFANRSLGALGVINNANVNIGTMATKYEHLRIRHSGDNYLFDASQDGTNWNNANVYKDVGGRLNGAQIGLMARDWNTGSGPSYTVTFDYHYQTDADLMPSALAEIATTTQVAQETGANSLNQTNAVNVCGTDLGEFFDWNGRTYVAFGDTQTCDGSPEMSNTLAYSTDTRPSDGIRFDGWVRNSSGHAKELFNQDLGTVTAIPTSGVGVGDNAYLFYMQVTQWGSPGHWSCNLSSIASAHKNDVGTWTKRSSTISWAPGNFNMVTVVKEGSTLYIWGTPCGRWGSVKLMKVDEANVLNKSAYRYFSGFGVDNSPAWSAVEAEAVAVAGGPAGELSVRYNSWLGRYIMSYLDEEKAAIVLRESATPWGPWSAPIQIAKASRYPQLYGAFMKAGFEENGGESIYFMMSKFDVYNTFLMKTSLVKLDAEAVPPPPPFGIPRGHVLDAYGMAHPFGRAPDVETGAYWPRWDIARGMDLRSDGTSGYLLDGWGGVHPFGGAPRVATTGYWAGWDIARGIVVRPDGVSGYVLDGWGGLHAFGGAPRVATTAYWPGWDIARGIVLRPDGVSGYVLDGWGGVHPFGNAPRWTASGYWEGWDIARGITLSADGDAGYVLDGWGGVHAFGRAPRVAASAYWRGWDIARSIIVRRDNVSGYVLDGWGGVHSFGGAPRVETSVYWPGSDIANHLVLAP